MIRQKTSKYEFSFEIDPVLNDDGIVMDYRHSVEAVKGSRGVNLYVNGTYISKREMESVIKAMQEALEFIKGNK